MRALRMRLSALFIAFAMAFGVGVVFNVATAPSADAATTTATNGYGKSFKFKGSDGVYRWYFVGDFVFSGKMRGFCIEPMKKRATTDVVGLISDLPGVTGETQRQVHHMANEAYYGYYDSKLGVQKMNTNTEGYRYAFAIWYKMGTNGVNRYNQAVSSGQLTSADVSAIKKIWDRAKRHGDYKVTVKLNAAKVGKSATGSAKIMNGVGLGAPVGTRILVTATNAKITSVSGVAGTKGRVTSNGYTYFRYTVTNTGPVTIKVRTYQPNSTQSKVSFPSSSTYQRLIGASSARSSYGKASFELREGAPAYANVCAPECDGTGTLTVTASNGGGKVLHEVFTDQFGKLVAVLDVLPGQKASKSVKVIDGQRITSKYCYTNTVGGSCVTGWVTNPGSYLVECPAWATAEITVGCNCTDSWASVKFIAPPAPATGAKRIYTGQVVLSKSGVVVGTLPAVTIPNGQSVVVPITMEVAAGLVIEARFSVGDGTKLLVSNKTLTKVMVLEVAGSSVKYSSSVGSLNDAVVKTATVKALVAN